MEKVVSRPTNAELGRPNRDKYIKVMLSEDEKAAIERAAAESGELPSALLRRLALAFSQKQS